MRVVFVSIILLKLAFCYNDTNENVKTVDEMKPKEFWMNDAQITLQNKLKLKENKNVAKNVILFIGDGMSIPTVTASRIYDGQKKGYIGERSKLYFEKFPYVGLSKTYCVDKQVADSACSATAYLCGVKANYNTIGVTADVVLNDCNAAKQEENQISSIAKWALDAGKDAGVLTTTRITHASPAGLYARTSNRDFESDYNVKNLKNDPLQCPDIARQLIENYDSRRYKVIMGGGSQKFLPNGTLDDMGNEGERLDGRNLINEWLNTKDGIASFVSSRDQLLNIDIQNTDYLLGLFSPSHMAYHLDSDNEQPTLEEMTEAAIKMLNKNDKGYFLFVEGGRIDHAHHETRSEKALDETAELNRAVKKAFDLTDSNETLIVVTADHGHTMTINGYPSINNDILGLNTEKSDVDGLPYSTLSYANGPAFKSYLMSLNGKVKRVDMTSLFEKADKNLQYPATVPLKDETHDGSEVPIYANGPWSHLFTGVLEQNTLPALMGFAACIGPGLHTCDPYYSYN